MTRTRYTSRVTNYGTKGLMPILYAGWMLGELACASRGKKKMDMPTDKVLVVTREEMPVPPPSDNLKCSADMKYVHGMYCPQVEQKCLRWLDVDKSPEANSGIGPLRCAEFAEPKCVSKTRREQSYCVDTYEYPNAENEFPELAKSWFDAEAKCESVGKRLCTAEEWTFACEGPDMKPYPYGDGLHRDDMACNIDQPSMDPSLPRSEWPKHNLSEPSGVRPNCVSPFGIHDMTGNVDEFVFNEHGFRNKVPYISGLKGGYWGMIRARCRPMTDVHSPDFSFYQIGWRCCKDSK